jgi:hypothetical protein
MLPTESQPHQRCPVERANGVDNGNGYFLHLHPSESVVAAALTQHLSYSMNLRCRQMNGAESVMFSREPFSNHY